MIPYVKIVVTPDKIIGLPMSNIGRLNFARASRFKLQIEMNQPARDASYCCQIRH